jgi:hypothetical protein
MAISIKSFDKVRKYLPWSSVSQKIIEKYCTTDIISDNSETTIETKMLESDFGSISEDSGELPESPIKIFSKSYCVAQFNSYSLDVSDRNSSVEFI